MLERRAASQPFFSICIPQYNRTSFLLEVCASLAAQHYQSFEVCISDDCSTDNRQTELLSWLEASRLAFVYRRLDRNGRYDKNLRSAIDLAHGKYCFLLGNDDVLAAPQTLGDVHAAMSTLSVEPAVVFTNFAEYISGIVTRRAMGTRVVGEGPHIAAASFRKFSFVSGILLNARIARALATDAWDGSEMYQMYVGCRAVATGGPLVEIDLTTVRKDLQLPGEMVDSYARRERMTLHGIPEQPIPLTRVPGLVIDALQPALTHRRFRTVANVLVQFYLFLYPFWLMEYRRVQSWRYAAGVARAMRPRRSLTRVSLRVGEWLCAYTSYTLGTICGLLTPLRLLPAVFDRGRRMAAWISNRAVLQVSAADSRTQP